MGLISGSQSTKFGGTACDAFPYRQRDGQIDPTEAESAPGSSAKETLSPLALFFVWSRIGFSSFGGGVATLGIIRQEFVNRRQWISEEEFLRDWSLCQLAPGINLIAIVILIGRRLGGTGSIAAALFGLLIPSFAATVAITAAYQFFSHSRFVVVAKGGMIPAIAGVGLATVLSMLIPIGKKYLPDGWAVKLFLSGLLVGCFLLFRMGQVSPVIVLLVAGGLGALFRLSQAKTDRGLG